MKLDNEFPEYKALLKQRLTDKRYYHSLCVADEAMRLAIKYGADPETAYLAGLLHDITKNASKEEHFEIFEQYKIPLSEIEKNAEKLWHAISGAAYVKYKLEISNREITDAIRYHTTAKAKMSLQAKILYLADFTSADRDYNDVDILRKLVDISLEDAFEYALAYSVCDLVNLRKAVHPDTVEAYNETVMKGK